MNDRLSFPVPGVHSQKQSQTGANIFRNYVPAANLYDEMCAASGEVRAHWQAFATALERLGAGEVRRRWAHAQRLIHENGIAYSAYGDPHGKTRPWQLDALPLLIPANEWQLVVAGLDQRARLLNLVLADLYGRQDLLRRGILPPEILFAHPNFRLPYHGQHASDGKFLHLYAADLGRSPDGKWWVSADRSEAPSGMGFALENRVVVSRMLPTIFRECHVQRLAPYFIELRETLRRIAPKHKDNPRVVILSQGPAHINYFEDAYLARYLGYTLVEAADLAVRGNQVMLKTLGGLLPVDVIWRRPNSEACDPLELDSHSSTGVAGLLQVVRGGNVAVVNSFGSGLVESPILMAFMPRLCQAFLGEELQLPGVATWWCGEPESLSIVLDKLDQLWVKHAFRRRGREREVAPRLNQMGRDQLLEMIKADPASFVAQERVVRSSAPLWSDASPRPAHVALRAYAVASTDSFIVMSGGLARTSETLESPEVSILAGEGSKDAWVLGTGPVEHVTLLQKQSEAVELHRGGEDLPSRVADNLYWLGRHIERVEAAARLLRTVTLRLTSETDLGSRADLPWLLRALAVQGQIDPGFAVAGIKDQLPAIEQALPSLVFNQDEIDSLRSMLNETYRLASSARDRLSIDSWRVVLRAHEEFQLPGTGSCDLTDLLNMTNQLIIDLSAFSGMVMESTTRSQAFRFLDFGRRLERAVQIIALLKNCFLSHGSIVSELVEAVLEVSDSLMTYRSRYRANLQLSAALDLLLTDETNPRSLAYQLAAINDHVDRLPRNPNSPGYATEQRLAMSMLHTVRMVDIQSICKSHRLGQHSELAELLEKIENQLPLISNAISHRYLVHAGPAQQLVDIVPAEATP